MEIVWSLLGRIWDEYNYLIMMVGCIFVGLFAFSQIWKIQLEKAYVRYTEMVYNHGLSMKKAEAMFMKMLFDKEKGSKSEHEQVRKTVRSAIKNGRLIKIDFTYEGEMSVRYFAHDEDLHAFRALMIKQAKWIKLFRFLRPFNIYRFNLHDLSFKKAIGQ